MSLEMRRFARKSLFVMVTALGAQCLAGPDGSADETSVRVATAQATKDPKETKKDQDKGQSKDRKSPPTTNDSDRERK